MTSSSSPNYILERVSDMVDPEYHYNEMPEEPNGIDSQLFDLIENDDANPRSDDEANAAFKALLQTGARVHAKKAYSFAWPGFSGCGHEERPLQGEYQLLTPLDVAAILNQPKWLEIFADAQIPIKSNTAAYWGAFAGSRRFLLELKWSGELDLSRSEFGVPLHASDPDITADFLEAGADVNALSAYGCNALSDPQLPQEKIRMLMAAGVDVNHADAEGVTPFQNLAWRHRLDGCRVKDMDARILQYIAFGLDLDAVIKREFRGDHQCYVREWISSKLYDQYRPQSRPPVAEFPLSDLAIASDNPQLFAAKALLKIPKDPPAAPPRKRAQFPVVAQPEFEKRESGVRDRIKVAAYRDHWGRGPHEMEWLPLARPIDQAIFDLIDRDAKIFMPYEVALGSLRHLLRLGASVECCRRYSISLLEYDTEEGYSYGESDPFYLKPLELAVHLNAWKWVRIFIGLGFSATCPTIASHAAAYPKFLQEMYECGALTSECLDAAFLAMARHTAQRHAEVYRANLSAHSRPAKRNERVEDLARVLEWGADVNTSQGDALEIIVDGMYFPDIDALRLLLSAGGNPNRVSQHQKSTPFANFLSKEHGGRGNVEEVICLFLTHGADVEVMIKTYCPGPREVTAREFIYAGKFSRAHETLKSQDARRAAEQALSEMNDTGFPRRP